MKRLRLRNRRGAFAIITAVGFFAMLTAGAMAVDFSRLWTLKNELQTAADAGAHAGAIQLMPSRYVNAQGVIDTVNQYATRNKSMGRTPVVDSIILGNWNNATRVFTAGAVPQNAVRVVTAFQMSGLIMSAFGVTAPRMRARATGWAEAPVATTGCIKPWAIPYENLMFAINNFRNIANTTANLTRAFDQVADMAALTQMNATQRTFQLKLGDNGNQNAQNSIVQGPATATTMPGNFQAVRLGKYWDAATQTYPNPGPNPGGSAYVDHITGTTCHGLSVGDSLQTETGNKVGPTVNNISPSVCTQALPTNDRLANFGDCIGTSGTVGADIKAAFFSCGMSGCNGQSTVGVKMLGSFKLMKVFPNRCNNNALPQFGACDRSEIVGVFEPLQAIGPVGGGSTTLQRPILTQ